MCTPRGVFSCTRTLRLGSDAWLVVSFPYFLLIADGVATLGSLSVQLSLPIFLFQRKMVGDDDSPFRPVTASHQRRSHGRPPSVQFADARSPAKTEVLSRRGSIDAAILAEKDDTIRSLSAQNFQVVCCRCVIPLSTCTLVLTPMYCSHLHPPLHALSGVISCKHK